MTTSWRRTSALVLLVALATACSIRPEETILEIGPGTGALTRELLATGGTVIAEETGRKLETRLSESACVAHAAPSNTSTATATSRNLKFLMMMTSTAQRAGRR